MDDVLIAKIDTCFNKEAEKLQSNQYVDQWSAWFLQYTNQQLDLEAIYE